MPLVPAHRTRFRRLRLIVIALAVAILVLGLLTTLEIVPRRSGMSISVGLLLLALSGVEGVLVLWLGLGHLTTQTPLDRVSLIALLLGTLAIAPIALAAVRAAAT